jgi:hypothetical protein
VKDAAAARDGIGPAGVGAQIGRHDGEPVARVDTGAVERRAYGRLAGDVAHRRTYIVTTAQELGDAPATEEAGAASDQD